MEAFKPVPAPPATKTTIFAACLLSLCLSAPGFAGDEAKNIVFHVTSVQAENAATGHCTTGECTATQITVEGYSDLKDDSNVTEYRLQCIEILANKPHPHYTIICPRVHAQNDYDAILYEAAIGFETAKSSPAPNSPIVAAYAIKSEKEAPKKK